jgi:hypothetical protein
MKLTNIATDTLYIGLDFGLTLLGIMLLAYIRADIVAMSLYVFIPLYCLATKRKHLLWYFLLSSIVAIFWQTVAGRSYGYNHDMIKIFYFDAFPLFAWAVGLFGIYVLYTNISESLKIKNAYYNFFLFSIFYWLLLLTIENIAYHQFGIMNIATEGFPGLPVCNCLHVPFWMQMWYLSAGPLFFILCQFLNKILKSYQH